MRLGSDLRLALGVPLRRVREEGSDFPPATPAIKLRGGSGSGLFL